MIVHEWIMICLPVETDGNEDEMHRIIKRWVETQHYKIGCHYVTVGNYKF